MLKQVLLGAALVAALGIPGPGAAAEGDAAALLAKHRAYVGWAAGDKAVPSLRETGTASRDGHPVAAIAALRYGVAYRNVYRRPNGIESDDGFTGSVFWTSNANGFTVRPVGEVVRYLADEAALFGELSAAYAGSLLRHETLDGADAAVVRLAPEVGFPIDVWIDPATGAYRRAVIDPGGKYETAFNGLGYKEAAGKRYLAAWHYGSSKTIYRYDEIEAGAALQPDQLRPPKQTASWSFTPGSAKVELTNDTFPRIYVEATMNGVKGKFIFDTGAGATALTDSYARRIGAKRVGRTTISGIGGDAGANLYRIDAIGVGPSTLHDVVASSGLVEDWFREEGVDGLIGFDLLAGAIVELDLDGKQLRILDPAKVEPDQSRGITVHADLSTNQIRVPMRLNGKFDVIATLDSGNPINVLFSRDLVSREHMVFFSDPGQLGSTRVGGGVAGAEIEHCGRLDSLALGPIQYRPVPACDSPSFGRNEVLVGLDFMKAFNYVFDYPDGIIVMEPRKNP